jgi:hypothetical protein
MAASAICLDQNQNSVSCSDPNCTYGDCGSTATQVTSGALCLDSNQNAVACSDPECTYGDCVSSAAGAVGLAGHANENGGTSLTTPSAGGATSAGSTSVLSSIASLGSTITTAVTGPPKTTLTLGASGLQVSSLGSIFSNPLMLALLAVIAALLFGLFRKK